MQGMIKKETNLAFIFSLLRDSKQRNDRMEGLRSGGIRKDPEAFRTQ
jgi:hypothetical protein